MAEKTLNNGFVKLDVADAKLLSNVSVHNPEIIKSLMAIIEDKNSPSVLVICELRNYFSLELAYGKELVDSCVNKLIDLFSEFFNEPIVMRIASSRILMITNERIGWLPFQDRLEKINDKLRGFGKKIKNNPIHLGHKVGATKLKNSKDLAKAIIRSEIALKYASQVGELASVYEINQEEIESAKVEMQMASYFIKAIAEKRLVIVYQPIVCAKSGKIFKYEALLRIKDDEGGLISAGAFVSIAEKLEFIDEIDKYILEMAVAELKASPELQLGINISALTVTNYQWHKLAYKLLDSDVASRLTIEITESSMGKDLEVVENFVEKMQSLGCSIAIDDFGAGYTSFKQLKVINADFLKIDGVFIRDINESPESQLFVRTLLEFSKAYNIKTVAEFVESGEIAKVLMDLGVDYLQGYYLGKPEPGHPWKKI